MTKRSFLRIKFSNISVKRTLISLTSILQAVKSAIKNTGKTPGPNTEIYGPRSEYGFLRTARRSTRMQDSSKPYNKSLYFTM